MSALVGEKEQKQKNWRWPQRKTAESDCNSHPSITVVSDNKNPPKNPMQVFQIVCKHSEIWYLNIYFDESLKLGE